MAIGFKRDRPPAPPAAPDVAELLERWQRQTARVSAAGDVLAVELRGLAAIWREADDAYPGPPVDARPRALGLELPARLVNLFLGGEGFRGLFETWQAESRQRGWLD